MAKVLDVADDYIKAAVFLNATSTLESLAGELSAQLEPGSGRGSTAVEDSSCGQSLDQKYVIQAVFRSNIGPTG